MEAIQLNELRKDFGDIAALKGVNLAIEDGEVFGLLGPNGAGKTTMINIILNFMHPTSGRVQVFGMNAQHDSLAIRRRSGFLPEGFSLYDRLTAREHLEFAFEAKSVEEWKTDPDTILERVGLQQAADRQAKGFSKGMQQRLALGIALIGDPDLLILDEPATGLDPTGAREIIEIIQKENDRGATVLLSSHIPRQIEALCDRIGILQAGEIVVEGKIQNLRDTVETERILDVILENPVDTIPEPIQNLDGINEATIEDGIIRVRTSRNNELTIIDALRDAGLTVESFVTDSTVVGDIFAEYTNEEARRSGLEADA